MRTHQVVKVIMVPLATAIVSTAITSYYKAQESAKRDDALLVAFRSSTQALGDAQAVLGACHQRLLACGDTVARAQDRAQREAFAKLREGAHALELPRTATTGLPPPPPTSAPTPEPSQKLRRVPSATEILDSLAVAQGWRR